MSGDNLLGGQPLMFYTEEMTNTKVIALSHFEKEFFTVSNSLIYLDQKRKEFSFPEAA